MIVISIDKIVQIACLACMAIGVVCGRTGVVVFGGFILIYSLIREIFVFDNDEYDDEDDDGGGGLLDKNGKQTDLPDSNAGA